MRIHRSHHRPGAMPSACVLALVACALSLTSCFSGLEFTKATQVEILSPHTTTTMAYVKVPFVMRWSSTIPRSSGLRYAVFFDSDPMAPGQTFKALVAQGDPCKLQPNCPNTSWLTQRQIFVTSATHIDVTNLALLPGETPGGDGTSIHTATIILVGPGNVRHTEGSWTVEFRVNRST